jgi:3-isopropylmalate dehydrogenase
MAQHRITVLPGDGTGKEVTVEALKLLKIVEQNSPISFEITEIPCGGQYYLETGEEWPAGSFEYCRDNSDAILLGAIGWPGAIKPNGDLAGGQVILGLRSGLDLYANVRPIKLYNGIQHKIHGEFKQVWSPGLVDMTIIRENTEGLYQPLLSRSAHLARGEEYIEISDIEVPGIVGEFAWDPRPISRIGSERVIRFAFELASKRSGCPSDGTSRVSCIDKSNVTRGCQLFRSIYHEIAINYPEIKTDEAYIDAFTMWLIRQPEFYDVVVVPNMFGDIVTDLASTLQGGMGMAASANIGDNHMLFEPVHGSTPKRAGKGQVNPIAMLSSVQLMLEWLGLRKEDDDALLVAKIVESSIEELISVGDTLTYDLGGSASTSEVSSALCKLVAEHLSSHYASV